MGRSQEFLDALETARSHVMERLARHDPEGKAHPSTVNAAIQRHAEQLHGAREMMKWKEERGMTRPAYD
jgi:hypothetical protein